MSRSLPLLFPSLFHSVFVRILLLPNKHYIIRYDDFVLLYMVHHVYGKKRILRGRSSNTLSSPLSNGFILSILLLLLLLLLVQLLLLLLLFLLLISNILLTLCILLIHLLLIRTGPEECNKQKLLQITTKIIYYHLANSRKIFPFAVF